MSVFKGNYWRLFMLLVSLLTGVWYRIEAKSASPITKSPRIEDGITNVMQKQCDAWNRGDLDAFMTSYLRSADTSYTSGGTEVWGYDALQERYRNKYGASRDTMGKLVFSNLKVFGLGQRDALCIGHWHLDRDKQPAVNGIFSLVFVLTKDGWKIVHDHTSVIPQ